MERRISVFFPLLLIAAGLIGIMIQFGTIQSSSLWALVYIWPLFLIAAGLGLILRGYWKYLTVVFDILVVGGAFLAVLFAPQLGWNRAPDYVITGNGISIGSSEHGSGKIITQSRQIPEFTKIRISYPAQVTVSQGGTESLTIEADDNVAGEIRTQVVDGELDINQVHNHQFIISPTRSPKITIVVKDLTELDFSPRAVS